MCDWTYAAYAAAVALAGYGANEQAEAANDAADRQAAALNAAMEQQDQWSRKAEEKAMDNAEEYTADKRTQRFEEARQSAGESLAQNLIKSREEGATTEQASGKLSDEFTTDRATKMAKQFQRSIDMAHLMGNMRGQQDMLGQEAITNADYASQLNTIGRNAKGTLDAAQPGIIAAGKVDSGKATTGALMQALGTSYLMNGAMSGLGSGSAGAGELGSGTYGMDAAWGGTPAAGSDMMSSAGGTGTGFDLGSGLGKSFKTLNMFGP